MLVVNKLELALEQKNYFNFTLRISSDCEAPIDQHIATVFQRSHKIPEIDSKAHHC